MQRRSKMLVTGGLMIAALLAALDQAVVDTAFPQMSADLGGVAIFTWVITAYLLASTAIVPVVGKLADLFGRKVFYLLGLGLFLAGSALSGAAHTMPQLIAFRVVQGLGGGMLMPVVLTIIGDLYPGKERGKLQGLFGAAFGLATIVGPKLGGWITHHFTWRWVFYINLLPGLAALLLVLFWLRESRGERRPIDYAGSVLVTAGVVLFMLALHTGQTDGWGSWLFAAEGLGALGMLGAFLAVERRAVEPVLDLSLFRNRTYAVMCVVSSLMGVGLFGCLIFVPWFIQGVIGVDPNVAGNVMMPMMLATMFASVGAGRAAMKVAYRWLVAVGFGLILAGFLIMTAWGQQTTLLAASLTTVLVGLGIGCLMPLMTLAVQNAVSARDRGQVTSGTTFFRSMGSVVGTTVFGILFNHGMNVRFAGTVAPALVRVAHVAPQAGAMLQQMAANPQGLLQVLLKPEVRTLVPAGLQGDIVNGIKAMMVGSLHPVFWLGVGVVLLGVIAGQFLGATSLPGQTAGLAQKQPSLLER